MRQPLDEPRALAEQFRHFATGAGRDGAPLYEQLCDAIAEDARVLELVAASHPSQRRPNILLAAVHYLLLAGVDHPLGALYPTVSEWRASSSHWQAVPHSFTSLADRGDGARARRDAAACDDGGAAGSDHAGDDGGAKADAYALFKDFVRRFGPDLVALMTSRSTQTNEVGRCSALLPALSLVAARWDQPLALIDLGTSAGLNLLFDRYAYHYSAPALDDRPPLWAGDARSPVQLEAELRHRRPASLTLPAVAFRLGVDRDPADPMDDDRSLWLLACQWPDHVDRFHRLHQALVLARSSADRPRLLVADAVEDLRSLADQAPTGCRLCILHSWMAAYLTPDEQVELGTQIGVIARQRPVSWIFAESRYETPGLPHPADTNPVMPGATSLVLVESDGDSQRAEALAGMHPHGRWIHWLHERTDTPPC